MFFILNKRIGLRKYNDPTYTYMYYIRGVFDAINISKSNFEFLKLCDGLHDVELSDDFRFMCFIQGIIIECEKGKEKLTPWQYMECNNRYFPGINLMITSKCNYNCLHCFNAKDSNSLKIEWDINELYKLIDDAFTCGIHTFTLTGGEPLNYSHFMDVVERIYSKGMYVQEINTNGYYIDDILLTRLKDIGCHAAIKISFDGLTHHDYLRNYEGAEEITKEAIKLCIKHGFETRIQLNVHRKNLDTLYETIEYLEELGVSSTRMIRTSESPRWLEKGKEDILSFEEFYDLALDFGIKYLSKKHKMNIDIWQTYEIYGEKRKINIKAIKNHSKKCNEDKLICPCIRGLVAIGANGNLYPCLQLSGYYDKYNICLGNVKREPLQKLLNDGVYVKEVCCTYKDLIDSNGKCASCKYVDLCVGGCLAIAKSIMPPDNKVIPPDLSKCVFFENGYYKKYKELIKGEVYED